MKIFGILILLFTLTAPAISAHLCCDLENQIEMSCHETKDFSKSSLETFDKDSPCNDCDICCLHYFESFSAIIVEKPRVQKDTPFFMFKISDYKLPLIRPPIV